jgi:nonribosomal peptide synthetase protein BlmIV
VVATRARRANGHRERAVEYWRARLPELPPAPALPGADDLAGHGRPTFDRLSGRLDAAEWDALRRAAATRDLTPSGLLCAAFAEVLAAWSRSGRFTLNLTTFDREPVHPDVDRLVGDFTSTTLLAVDATGATFLDRARCLQRQLFRDLEHRQFSGIEVLRLLRADPRRRADVYAPIVFTSTLLPGAVATVGRSTASEAWDAEPVFGISQTPQVLLDHQVHEYDGCLVHTWDHVVGAFPPGLIEAMFHAHERLLQSLIQDDSYWKAAPAWTR